MSGELAAALKAADWSGNIGAFCKNTQIATAFEDLARRLAVWSTELNHIECDVEAIKFIREASLQSNFVCAAIGLGLYKPAAGSMRTLVECVLYYTYFRTHPIELATLAREPSFFLQKSEIIGFHQRHTQNFAKREAAVGLLGKLTAWYSEISAIVHGQVPGAWTTGADLAKTVHDEGILKDALKKFEMAVAIVDALLFVTVAQDLWGSVSIESKRLLMKDLSGSTKRALGLALT